MEIFVGVVVLTLIVVVVGPALWSSRLSLRKSDDPNNDSRPDKPGA